MNQTVEKSVDGNVLQMPVVLPITTKLAPAPSHIPVMDEEDAWGVKFQAELDSVKAGHQNERLSLAAELQLIHNEIFPLRYQGLVESAVGKLQTIIARLKV